VNARERVLTAVDHRRPDRLPLDIGGTGVSSAPRQLQQRMVEILGLRPDPNPYLNYFDNALQMYFGCDLRRIGLRGPRNAPQRFDEQGRRLDEWGVHDYNDSAHTPLRHASIADLERYPWPNPYDPGRIEGLKEQARYLHEETPYAIVADAPSHGLFEGGCRLRGYDTFLADFALQPDFVRVFFDHLLDFQLKMVDVYMGEIGDYIDIIWLGDDVCTQRGPYISPAMYRRLVKPYFKEYIHRIRKYTRARIMHHCCGACSVLIPDYLDLGIEILTPAQPEAEGMQPERLKELFGGRMTFHGGIGLQHILPHGSRDEIAHNVRATAQILGRNGGYILAPGHTVPDDVSAENVLTMLEAARDLRLEG
jgi:uroporphyrinogen decarboxylase